MSPRITDRPAHPGQERRAERTPDELQGNGRRWSVEVLEDRRLQQAMWAQVGATNASLVDLVDARALESPNELLFVDDRGRRMNCAEFQADSDRAAKRLASLGVGPDSLVSWILPTNIEALVIMVGL